MKNKQEGMKIEGWLIKKWDDGTKIDENCQFNIDKINPQIFNKFDHSKSIGEIDHTIFDENGIKCTGHLYQEQLTIHLTRREKFVNFLKPKYKERTIFDYLMHADNLGFAIGGRVKEIDGNVIKDIDISEVSLTNNPANPNTGIIKE